MLKVNQVVLVYFFSSISNVDFEQIGVSWEAADLQLYLKKGFIRSCFP